MKVDSFNWGMLFLFTVFPLVVILSEFLKYPKWLELVLEVIFIGWMMIAVLSFIYSVYSDIRNKIDPLWKIKERIKQTKD